MPVGRVSVTVNGPFAVDEPLFVTVKVYLPVAPTTNAPPATLVIARSAGAMTGEGSMAVLFVGSGSVVGLDTVAVFVTDGTAEDDTPTTRLNIVLTPTPSVAAFVQVTF